MKPLLKKWLLLIGGLIVSVALQAKDFVVISEIMYDSPLNEQTIPNTPSYNGEFVELFNPGVDPVNLTGWTLRGGSVGEVYAFPENTILTPKSYLIVAYQYSSAFTFDQLYTGVTATPEHQIQYQKKIVLSNSGEAVYLRNANGITKDSIFYDGNTSASIPNKLRADNANGTAGNSCYSIQRKSITFNDDAIAIPNRQDWAINTVSVFKQHASYQEPYLPGVGVRYYYDMAGNRILRKLVTLDEGRTNMKKDESAQPVEDYIGEYKVIIYPNPTHGAIAIEIKGNSSYFTGKAEYLLFNGQGALMQRRTLDASINPADLSSYPDGWYILRVIVENKVTEFKIIKQ